MLQQIGEGGMGVVYMAEQTEPIERRVALKIIKPGMDTMQVIARFEAERQALAMMDHPNIARALDAGVTGAGRPYFVMELVKGVPITEYCDEHQRTPRQRLELFIPVCQAIQHAHQKGIIHRDIKPSNVLVADYDNHSVPKVIDFGVAKAIDHRLTEKTMFTEFGQVLGTFEYMSPEQAKLNQWDVDTRTDVYSLGVLLYELLSGETPFDRQRLRSAAFDELLRIIREDEPPKPSTRASTSQSLPTIADNRKTEPAKLGAAIRGELDWIVMKALDKDRGRRYETANGLAADIERHLNDEPVVAGPPLAHYRLAKFVKRNKLQVVAAAAVAAALVMTLVGTSVGMAWALRERSRADTEAARATLSAQAEAKARQKAQENEQRAVKQKEIAERELARATEIKQLITQMLDSVDPVQAQGEDTTLLRGILDDASQRLAEGEIADELVAASLHDVVGRVYLNLGLYGEAEKHHGAAVAIGNRDLGSEHSVTLSYAHNLALAYEHQNRVKVAERLYEQTLKARTRVLGPEHPNTLQTMRLLAGTYRTLDRTDEAESIYKALIKMENRVLGPEHTQTLLSKYCLAGVYIDQGRISEAEILAQNTLALQLRVLSDKHPHTLHTMALLALIHEKQGNFEQASALFKRVSEKQEQVLGLDHPVTRHTYHGLNHTSFFLAREKTNAEVRNRSATEWVRELQHSEDNLSWGSPLKMACKTLASRPEVFRRVAEILPEESTLWIGRGQHHALLSEWEKAASDYARGFKSRSLGDRSIFEYAGSLVLVGDQQGYRRLCKQMVGQLGEPDDARTAFAMTRTCALSPDNNVPRQQVAKWADMSLNESKFAWVLHVKGLAQYRAGQYEEAFGSLKQSINTGSSGDVNALGAWGDLNALNWIVQAMCHHKLGNTDRAQECFATATTSIEMLNPPAGEAAAINACDWIEWHVLHREAKQLLGIDSDNSKKSELLDSS
ncbi:serine/threonine-protein kinase [Aeoliella sp. ICT_H6.2]|uniref:Serine/threonine-protein kinase n=1 Tax=Aeoliella straminimaris TaxID=2954799 RepID=A0A9X2JKA5_9BACT|nr:serine/threonine-protein kinase [Aeoliella straminimaris]MCO6046139.1 serine/threonine-protein kinase [Aeoliella straminimaris]